MFYSSDPDLSYPCAWSTLVFFLEEGGGHANSSKPKLHWSSTSFFVEERFFLDKTKGSPSSLSFEKKKESITRLSRLLFPFVLAGKARGLSTRMSSKVVVQIVSDTV